MFLLWLLSYRKSYKSCRNHQSKYVILATAKMTCYHSLLYCWDCSLGRDSGVKWGRGKGQSPFLWQEPRILSCPCRCQSVCLRRWNNHLWWLFTIKQKLPLMQDKYISALTGSTLIIYPLLKIKSSPSTSPWITNYYKICVKTWAQSKIKCT